MPKKEKTSTPRMEKQGKKNHGENLGAASVPGKHRGGKKKRGKRPPALSPQRTTPTKEKGDIPGPLSAPRRKKRKKKGNNEIVASSKKKAKGGWNHVLVVMEGREDLTNRLNRAEKRESGWTREGKDTESQPPFYPAAKKKKKTGHPAPPADVRW